MGTIYLDMGFPELKDGLFRAFHWDKAQTIVKESDSLIISERYTQAWPHIIQFLGQYALNMRQVSTYFRCEKFRPFYEQSPLEPKAGQFWMDPFHQLMNSRLVQTAGSFTNISVKTSPQSDDLKGSCICVNELELIARRMPKLNSLSTLYIYMPLDYDRLESGALPVLPITKILSHLSRIRWALFLNPDRFPSLRELKFEAAVISNGLDRLPSKLMYSLRRLELHGFISKEEGHYSGIKVSDIFKVLRQVPLLEQLHLGGVLSLEEETVELEPESIQALKVLHIKDSRINPIDFRILLAAAPFIQKLILSVCKGVLDVLENLAKNDLPRLDSVTISLMSITERHTQVLLEAAPQLKTINIDYQCALQDDEKIELPLVLYPSVRKLTVTRCYRDKFPQTGSLLTLIERMTDLRKLKMSYVDVSQDHIDESLPEAYRQLQSLSILMAHVSASYLTELLNRAKGLRKLEWCGSSCDWMFQKVDETALSQLTSVSIRNVNTSAEEIMSLLRRAVYLRNLQLLAVQIKEPAGEMSFSLPVHSLPNLKQVFVDFKMTEEQCLVLLKAASHLETLKIPRDYLHLFTEALDGYFPHLKDISCSHNGADVDVDLEQFPDLFRAAPRLIITRIEGHSE